MMFDVQRGYCMNASISLLDRFKDELLVIFTAILPISELRGAIPLAHGLDMSPLKALLLACLGNALPVLPILLGLRHCEHLIRKIPYMGGLLDWATRRTERHRDEISKYGALGLILFVAVPLPTTGAWTASLAAFVFRIKYRYAVPAIFIGIVAAGIIVSLVATGFSLVV